MTGKPWNQKPPFGTPLDDSHPLGTAGGLVFHLPVWERCGSTLTDIVNGVPLTLSGAGSWVSSNSRSGTGFLGELVSGTLPTEILLTPPFSIVASTTLLSAAPATVNVITLAFNRPNTAPYNVNLFWNAGAGAGANLGAKLPTPNSNYATYNAAFNSSVGGSFLTAFVVPTPTTYQFYVNGKLVTSGPFSAAVSLPYVSTAFMYLMQNATTMPLWWSSFYNRALTPDDNAALYQNPWQIYEPVRSFYYANYADITEYVITGPSNGNLGVASSTFSVAPNNPVTDTVTLSDGGGGGSFTPSSLSFTSSNSPKTFIYSPTSLGTKTLTIKSGAGYPIPTSPWSYRVGIGYTLTGPSTAISGQATTNFTMTQSAAYADTITLSDGAAGRFTPQSLTFNGSTLTNKFTYTPVSGGVRTLTATSAGGGIISGSPATVTVFTVSLTLSGPPGGRTSQPATFTVTPSGATNDTITFSDTGGGGIFSQALNFATGTPSPQTFSYVPTSSGTHTITVYSADNAPVAGSPFTYASSALVPSAYVSKCGKLAIFGFANSTGQTNGYYPPACISTVTSSPTVYVNGNPVQIGAPTWTTDSPIVAFLLRCGSVKSIPMSCGATAGFTSPRAVWNGDGGGSGLTVGTPLTSVGVISYTVTNGGSTLSGNFKVTISGGSPTAAANAICIVTGGVVTSVLPFSAGVLGYGSGYQSTPGTQSPGNGVTFTCTIGTYIESIPVTNGGTGFTSPPTFTITDSGSGAGAIAAPIMTGVASTDVLTYSTTNGWTTTTLGTPYPVTGASMTNFVGQLEGPVGNLPGFTATPTMLAGGSVAAQPTAYSSDALFWGKNKLLTSDAWSKGGGTTTINLDANYYPSSWTPNGIIYTRFYGWNSYTPQATGLWTLVYDDAYYSGGEPAPTSVYIPTYGVNTTVTPVSTTISGTTVTKVFNVELVSNPSSFALQLYLFVQSTDGLWHLSNPWVFAPGNTIDRSNRFAVDDNVVRYLTGPTGRGPGVLRFLDSLGYYGGQSNYVDASDLQNPNLYSWQTPYEMAGVPNSPPSSSGNPTPAGTAVFSYMRFLNTNPASPTYSWSSPRVYGDQVWAASGTDSFGSYLDMTQGPNGANDNGNLLRTSIVQAGSIIVVELRSTVPHNLKTGQSVSPYGFLGTQNGTLTNGSSVVTGLSSTSTLNPGNAVWGNGVPAGATIATVNSATSVTLSANATSSGISSLQFMISIPATTLGTVVLPNVNNWYATVYVTGEYTIALPLGTGQYSLGTAVHVNSVTEIPVHFATAIQVPWGCTIPFEFAASTVSYFPNCALWLNIPWTANDACVTAIAQKIAAYIGPTNEIVLELGNEHWNTNFNEFPQTYFLASLVSYLPTGTQLWPFTDTAGVINSYTATNGVTIPNGDMSYTLQAAHSFSVFEAAWVAAGLSSSRIKRSFGSQWEAANIASNVVSTITRYGVPADYIHIAPYYCTALTASMIVAFDPAGYPAATAGNWPVDAINDALRHYMFYSSSIWTAYSNQAAAIAGTGLKLVCYECSLEGVYGTDEAAQTTDCYYHPSFYDFVWCYFLSMQQGDPFVANSGIAMATYYEIYGLLGPYGLNSQSCLWQLASGVAQAPGIGTSNQYLTPQGGAPGIRSPIGYAQTNVSPGLAAFTAWNNVATPFYAPTDLSLTPAPGAVGVSTRTIVAVQFNEPMNGATITPATFNLTLGSQSITGTVTYNPSTWIATFTPASALSFPTTFTARLTTGIQNVEGTALAAPITWGFTTTGVSPKPRVSWFSGLARPIPRVSA